MRKITGLDLNGWSDLAARDTPLDHKIEDGTATLGAPSNDPIVIDGGIGGVVVRLPDDHAERNGPRYVGGPQAARSPIGRGPGWGSVGSQDRRSTVSRLLSTIMSPSDNEILMKQSHDQLRAAVEALTAQTDEIIAVVPDNDTVDGERQERILDVFRRRRVAVRLLWQPVAVLIFGLELGLIGQEVLNRKICLINHTSDGLDIQSLRVRALPEYPSVLAPEREGPGLQLANPCGLTHQLKIIQEALAEANPSVELDRHDPSRLPLHILLDENQPTGSEILRNHNGTWSSINPINRDEEMLELSLPDIDVYGADLVLLTTPLASPFREKMQRAIKTSTLCNVLLLPRSAAAQGALAAGKRIEKGIPHYLDKLEQISLLVLREDEVRPEDLVPEDAIVAANREYVSKPVTGFAWPGGAKDVIFYLRKGGEFRRWQTDNVEPPLTPVPVEVRLRQMPAQGRAHVWITSNNWQTLKSRPITLDWSKLVADPRSFEDISAELKPKPIIPRRIFSATHLDLWKGSPKLPAFEQFILAFSISKPGQLEQLGKFLSQAKSIPITDALTGRTIFQRTTLLDYDGNAPEDVSPQAVAALDSALVSIANAAISVAQGRATLTNNALLKAATWAFGRCPDSLQDEIFRAVKIHLSDAKHPFLGPRASARVLVHGLGRVVHRPERLAKSLDLLLQYCGKPNVAAAIASLLSRPECVSEVLNETRTHEAAQFAKLYLEELKRDLSFGGNLKYALNIVAGLLRCRELRPYALVRASSQDAAELYTVLARIRELLSKRRDKQSQSTEKLEIIENLLRMIDGNGGDAGILVSINQLSDDSSEDD